MDPVAVIRSRAYLSALVLAALLGVPISAVAYGFLALVTRLQQLIFEDLPEQLLTGSVPAWWPVPWLVLCGLLTGLVIRYLPGNGGHSPAFGFQTGGSAGQRPGAGRCRSRRSDHAQPGRRPRTRGTADRHRRRPRRPGRAPREEGRPADGLTIMASAGSFAAISTLFGSPLLAAFLIMEVAGVGGVALSLVALPGLLASGHRRRWCSSASTTGQGSATSRSRSRPSAPGGSDRRHDVPGPWSWVSPAHCWAGRSGGSACRCGRSCTSTGCSSPRASAWSSG